MENQQDFFPRNLRLLSYRPADKAENKKNAWPEVCFRVYLYTVVQCDGSRLDGIVLPSGVTAFRYEVVIVLEPLEVHHV